MMLLGDSVLLRPGARVWAEGRPGLLPVGEAFLGRAVDGEGLPIDGGPAIHARHGRSIPTRMPMRGPQAMSPTGKGTSNSTSKFHIIVPSAGASSMVASLIDGTSAVLMRPL